MKVFSGFARFLKAVIGWFMLLIRSAHKDKKKAEAARAEETQYQRRQAEEERAHSRQERQAAIPYVAVECPGCGAVARVRKGGVGRCEYCDTPLEGK